MIGCLHPQIDFISLSHSRKSPGAVAVSSTIFGRAAFSERASLLPSIVFTFISTAFIYPVIVHWTWGEGWLSDNQAC